MSDKTKLCIAGMVCCTILFIAVFVWPTRHPNGKGGAYTKSLAGAIWEDVLEALGLDE